LTRIASKFAGLVWIPVLIPLGTIWFRQSAVRILAAVDVRPEYLVYAIAVIALVLGWRFNRSRIAFAALVALLGFHLSAVVPGSWRSVSPTALDSVSVLLALALPINFAGIAFLKERGVLTASGIAVIAVLLVQGVLIYQFAHGKWFHGIEPTLSRLAVQEGLRFPHLPLVSQLVALGGILLFALRLILWRSPIDAGLLAAMILTTLALQYPGSADTVAVFAIAAILSIQVALLQDSHARVYIDELTGLRARRALEEQFLRLGRRYTIAMIDVDHFKNFNDRFGHDVGDQALRYVAKHLERTGGGARAFRYGGEEFTLLFPRKGLADVLETVDALRERIASETFAVRGRSRPDKKPKVKSESNSSVRVPLTVSIGLAQPDTAHITPQEVVQRADEQLYRAKRSGRNRVEPRTA
jgi:diguanylate cyclase (GGDEF)-like protein